MERSYDSGWILAVMEDLIAFSAENRMPRTEHALSRALQIAILESGEADPAPSAAGSTDGSNVLEMQLFARPKHRRFRR